MSNLFKAATHPLSLALAIALGSITLPAHAKQTSPNILVIMADDLGWLDIAPYGGEIQTPYLDALAKEGVSFTNFFVSPYSSLFRAMFLTGADPHEVGLGNIYELNTPEQAAAPNYVGHLTDNATTIAQRFKNAGYHTVLSGKWHLGKAIEHQPNAWGFDDSFALLNGEANNYRYQDRQDSPDGRDLYSHNGADVQLSEGVFSTDFYTDYLLESLSKQPAEQSFFAFLAYTAPHSPLQAPQAYVDKYQGFYHDGPQALADQRFARLQQMGLVSKDAAAHPLIAVPDWQSLSDDQRAVETMRMQLYAAMVNNMDHNIGRVISHLKATGQYDNTVIVFLSDNGAAGASREASQKWGSWIRASRDNVLANMGQASSYVSTGPAWAQASMSPFAYFKEFTTDGGIRSPLIIKAPTAKAGSIEGRYSTLKDLAPTLLDLAGVSKATAANKTPMTGMSLNNRLAAPSAQLEGPIRAESLEMRGHRQVRQGNFKAVYTGNLPAGLPIDQLDAGQWKLYDVYADPGETNDIAKDHPEVLAALIEQYAKYSDAVKVVEIIPINPQVAD